MTEPRGHLIGGLRSAHCVGAEEMRRRLQTCLASVARASLLVFALVTAPVVQAQSDKQNAPPASSLGERLESQDSPPASTTQPGETEVQQPSAQPRNREQQQLQQQQWQPWYSSRTGEIRGSRLIGVTVRNDAGENIGDINEIVIARDGRVASIVIGVGGFLGIGERNVAVSFNTVRMTVNSSNEPIVVLTADRMSLSNAPEWKWSDADQSGVTGSGTGPSVTPPTGSGSAPGMGQSGVPRVQR